jgi:hypothetical protein
MFVITWGDVLHVYLGYITFLLKRLMSIASLIKQTTENSTSVTGSTHTLIMQFYAQNKKVDRISDKVL